MNANLVRPTIRGVVLLWTAALAGCFTSGTGAERPLAQFAGARPARNPAFDPATRGYNPNVVAGPRKNAEQVFIIPWKGNGTEADPEREAERQRILYYYRVVLMRDPSTHVEHHLFQSALKEQFDQLGIDVDLFTILVDPAKHSQAHSGKELYGPGGMWNWEWKAWLDDHENEGRNLLSAWEKAFEMIDKYGLGPHGPLSPYRCGRDVVHDIYDEPATKKNSK